jgi:hypothetical protein
MPNIARIQGQQKESGTDPSPQTYQVAEYAGCALRGARRSLPRQGERELGLAVEEIGLGHWA